MTQGDHRSGSDVLTKVEPILAQLGTLRRPGGHFREVSLGQGRLLSVDVFQSGADRGHVRVHLHGTIVRPTSPPPAVVPSGTVRGCSACRNAPDGPFPATYTGPRGQREYFGFQWHTHDIDVGPIEAAARWLTTGWGAAGAETAVRVAWRRSVVGRVRSVAGSRRATGSVTGLALRRVRLTREDVIAHEPVSAFMFEHGAPLSRDLSG